MTSLLALAGAGPSANAMARYHTAGNVGFIMGMLIAGAAHGFQRPAIVTQEQLLTLLLCFALVHVLVSIITTVRAHALAAERADCLFTSGRFSELTLARRRHQRQCPRKDSNLGPAD